jgi:ATP-binding cassette, subfamily C, bacterial
MAAVAARGIPVNGAGQQESRGALMMLRAFVRAYPGRSALALLGLLIAGVLDGLGLSTLLSMLSLAAGGGDDPSLPERIALDVTFALGLEPTPASLLLLGIALISVKALVVLLANRQVGYAVAHVATDLRLALIRAVMASRWRYYLSQPLGQLSNAVATEAQRAAEGFLHGAIMASLLIHAVIYAGLTLLISWQASLAALAAGALMLLALNVLVRIAGRAGRNQTRLLKSLLTAMTDQLSAVKPLKAMAREAQVDHVLASQTRELKKALRRQVLSKEALTAFQEPLLAVLVGVGFFVLLVHLELPLAAVAVLLFLLARVMNFAAKAQRSYQHMSICESAYWSLRDSIDTAEAEREPIAGHLEPQLRSELSFDGVSFSHGGAPILERQSFAIPARGLTVVTGPSGTGKTTLVDLVVGLLRPDEGRILIDGVPLPEIDQRRWRQNIGYVPQEPLLVNASVLTNVTLGDPALDEAAARRALEAADAWSFVCELPQGLHTPLGERGGKLSGGQRQRLAIARALVHGPGLLILDEATSNLDPESEAAVLQTISRLKGSLTLLAVTHETGLLQIADCVFRMRNGRVYEEQMVDG